MSYSEEDLIMISALAHFYYCRRRCALIHIEQLWDENIFTAEGRIMHEHVHEQGQESRGNVRIERGLSLRSLKLGLIGKADVVEFHRLEDDRWQPFPVEYKRGKPKPDACDKVQLCGQALCLEEMLAVEVPTGALYYGKTRRRLDVFFDQALRDETEKAAIKVHEMIASGITPKAVYSKKCKSCSLLDRCLPQVVQKKRSVMAYLKKNDRGRMKKHLNTLFVTSQGAYLSKEGETVAVKVENEVRLRLPIHTLGGIVCFGNVLCSPFLLGFCAERDVAVSFLTTHGRFLARVQGPVSGNVLLRREQYRRADNPEASAEITRSVLTGKLANCRTVLQRAVRDHGDKVDIQVLNDVSTRISRHLDRLPQEPSLDILRGIEGDSAHMYFSVFNHLITAQKEDFVFEERNRRPPLDNVNCLLSFIYTLTMHDIRSALETVGLDPAVGFLHRDRPGRPGLALDLMEEFRPFFAERLALSLINLRKVQKNGFEKTDTGAVFMTDETRKEVLVTYQNRKQDEITHPFLGEKITMGMLFHIQAMLFARYLRGDLDGYPPFIWR